MKILIWLKPNVRGVRRLGSSQLASYAAALILFCFFIRSNSSIERGPVPSVCLACLKYMWSSMEEEQGETM